VPRLAIPSPGFNLGVVSLALATIRQTELLRGDLMFIDVDGGDIIGDLLLVNHREYVSSLDSSHVTGVCHASVKSPAGVHTVQ
jgi:hypothetical protein